MIVNNFDNVICFLLWFFFYIKTCVETKRIEKNVICLHFTQIFFNIWLVLEFMFVVKSDHWNLNYQ